jgi:hypothetical protein
MAANLVRKWTRSIPTPVLRSLANLWPPYFGAGIKILELSKDFRYLKVCLKRNWLNTNYVNTQFGGSIYSMVDPFYMLLLMNNLGPEYIVWDKAAQIEFIKPGRTKLFAEFSLDSNLLKRVKERTKHGDKYIFDLPVDVSNEKGETVAHVVKTLYVRKKGRKNSS